MIKNVFKLNGKPISILSSWDDMIFDGYERILLLKDDDIPELVSVITGIDKETLEKAEITGIEKVLEVATFMKTNPEWPDYTDRIGPYTIPGTKNGKFEIQFESLGQFEDMRKIMKRCNTLTDLISAYPEFIAIYLQKLNEGEYSYTKAMEMVPSIRKMPAKEVIALGSFFFLKLRNLLNGTAPSSPKTTPSQKKSKQASRNSTKGSGLMPR